MNAGLWSLRLRCVFLMRIHKPDVASLIGPGHRRRLAAVPLQSVSVGSRIIDDEK